jgi:predicted PurR-regulated permease PerM
MVVNVEPDNGRNRRDSYRALLVVGGLLVLAWVIWSARGALFPFAIGAIIAYLLAPLVSMFEKTVPFKRRLTRPAVRTIAVIEVYLLFIGIFVILALTIIPVMVDQSRQLVEDLPLYWEEVGEEFDYWNRRYESEVPPEIKEQIDANYDEITAYLSDFGSRIASTTIGSIQRFVGLIVGLVLLPLWVFYVLKDQRHGMAYFYRLWPEEIREDVYQIVRIVDRILSSYIRGQLLLGLIVGVVTGVGMWVIGVQQPLALGIVAGIFEMVPILGPWISFIVAAIVVLATDPDKIFLVAILSLAIQQLENTFLVPRVQGNAVNMNPALIMMLLVVGGSLWGFIGIVIIVPLAAVARDVFTYVYARLEHPEEEDESKLSPAGPLTHHDDS